MPIVAVDDPSDPRLVDYRDVREADRIRRDGVFLAEGEVVLRVLASRGRFPLRSLLLAQPRVASLADLLASLPPELPVYVAPQATMSQLVGFDIHRGILAAGHRGDPPDPAALLDALPPGPCRVVALEGIVNHDNVGGIFRNCAAFGASAVLLDNVTCDPLYRKAIRVSAGASFFVPFARCPDPAALLALLRGRGFTTLSLTPDPTAVDIARFGRDLPVPERVALLLGAEGPGLSDATLGGSHLRVRVAMAPGFDSLNVATTSGVALHRFFL